MTLKEKIKKLLEVKPQLRNSDICNKRCKRYKK